MKNIKELFFNFVTTSKTMDYYRYNDSVAKKDHLSNNNLSAIYTTKKIDNHMIFFHYFEAIVQIAKINPQKLTLRPFRNIYYLGYKSSSRYVNKLILQDLPNIYWVNRNKLYAFVVETLGLSIIGNVINHKIVNKSALFTRKRLFYRVNFLSEEINGWVLSSIFLWTTPVYIENNRLSHEILHVYGVYKNRGKTSLSVELRFYKKPFDMPSSLKERLGHSFLIQRYRKMMTNEILEAESRKRTFRISFNNKKRYSIIVQVNNLTGKDSLNFDKEMRIFIAETIQNLKYYYGAPGL
jgi:hypothetical protein